MPPDDGDTYDLSFVADHFDEAFGFAFCNRAVVMAEILSRHIHGSEFLSRCGFGQADLRKFGIGVGDPG
jgi:hypothetical protein